MTRNHIPVLVFYGPTGTGKSALAESFFSVDSPAVYVPDWRGRAEIISADSMQVYRGMDIGTAKPDTASRRSLPHHIIDLVSPDCQFGSGDFVRLADEACADIHARGKLPVIVGGTGFYIKNFLYGLPVTPESDTATRIRITERMRIQGAAALMAELAHVDPVSASRISLNDEYRIIRALEVYENTGRPLSSFALPSCFRKEYRFLVLFLDRPRPILYERIEQRVARMFLDGLADEVRSLVDAGFTASDPGMRAIGYREFFGPAGEFLTADTGAIANSIVLDSKKYAKRQETFIRSIPAVVRVPAEDTQGIHRLVSDFLGT